MLIVQRPSLPDFLPCSSRYSKNAILRAVRHPFMGMLFLCINIVLKTGNLFDRFIDLIVSLLTLVRASDWDGRHNFIAVEECFLITRMCIVLVRFVIISKLGFTISSTSKRLGWLSPTSMASKQRTEASGEYLLIYIHLTLVGSAG